MRTHPLRSDVRSSKQRDDLKSLPMPELEKKLASSPEGLTQAEAEKRLVNMGRTRLKAEKTNLLLKFLSYFWGPIPWMIEVAVILSALSALARFFRHPCFTCFQRLCRILGRASGGQRHRRSEGHACDPGKGPARWKMGKP